MVEFSNGLFGCFNNCTLCLITYFVPCYTAGKNAEAVGDSCVMVGALYAVFPIAGVYFAAKAREKIREQKGIDVSSSFLFFAISMQHLHLNLCFLQNGRGTVHMMQVL